MIYAITNYCPIFRMIDIKRKRVRTELTVPWSRAARERAKRARPCVVGPGGTLNQPEDVAVNEIINHITVRFKL